MLLFPNLLCVVCEVTAICQGLTPSRATPVQLPTEVQNLERLLWTGSWNGSLHRKLPAQPKALVHPCSSVKVEKHPWPYPLCICNCLPFPHDFARCESFVDRDALPLCAGKAQGAAWGCWSLYMCLPLKKAALYPTLQITSSVRISFLCPPVLCYSIYGVKLYNFYNPF